MSYKNTLLYIAKNDYKAANRELDLLTVSRGYEIEKTYTLLNKLKIQEVNKNVRDAIKLADKDDAIEKQNEIEKSQELVFKLMKNRYCVTKRNPVFKYSVAKYMTKIRDIDELKRANETTLLIDNMNNIKNIIKQTTPTEWIQFMIDKIAYKILGWDIYYGNIHLEYYNIIYLGKFPMLGVMFPYNVSYAYELGVDRGKLIDMLKISHEKFTNYWEDTKIERFVFSRPIKSYLSRKNADESVEYTKPVFEYQINRLIYYMGILAEYQNLEKRLPIDICRMIAYKNIKIEILSDENIYECISRYTMVTDTKILLKQIYKHFNLAKHLCVTDHIYNKYGFKNSEILECYKEIDPLTGDCRADNWKRRALPVDYKSKRPIFTNKLKLYEV